MTEQYTREQKLAEIRDVLNRTVTFLIGQNANGVGTLIPKEAIEFLLSEIDRLQQERDMMDKTSELLVVTLKNVSAERDKAIEGLQVIADYGGKTMQGNTCAFTARSILSDLGVSL